MIDIYTLVAKLALKSPSNRDLTDIVDRLDALIYEVPYSANRLETMWFGHLLSQCDAPTDAMFALKGALIARMERKATWPEIVETFGRHRQQASGQIMKGRKR